MHVPKTLFVACLAASVGGAACGKASPAAPAGLSPPTTPFVASQHVHLTGDDVQVNWAGTSPSFVVEIGTGTGLSDTLVTETTTPTFTWTDAKPGLYRLRVRSKNGTDTSGPSGEAVIVSIDLREVIEALYFNFGPFSQGATSPAPPSSTRARVWPEGQQIRLLISKQVSDSNRQGAQSFIDNMATLTNGSVTAFIELTDDTMPGISVSSVPVGTIAIRISASSACGTGAIGCTSTLFDAAGLLTRALVSIDQVSEATAVLEHEIGHGYGLFHLATLGGASVPIPLMSPTYNPALLALTETEVEAIKAVRAAGIIASTNTWADFLAKGLVKP